LGDGIWWDIREDEQGRVGARDFDENAVDGGEEEFWLLREVLFPPKHEPTLRATFWGLICLDEFDVIIGLQLLVLPILC